MAKRRRERPTGEKHGRVDPTRWPPSVDRGRRRVLIEYPHTGTPTVLADVLERAGYDTVICEGPADAPETCRLLRDGECELAGGTDVIFNGFGLAREEHREIVRELRRSHPDTPLVVETTRPRADANADLLDDCTRCHSPLSAQALLAAVRHADTGSATAPG